MSDEDRLKTREEIERKRWCRAMADAIFDAERNDQRADPKKGDGASRRLKRRVDKRLARAGMGRFPTRCEPQIALDKREL